MLCLAFCFLQMMPYDCFFSHNFSFQVKVSAADRSTSPVTGSIIAVTSDPAKQTICIEGPTATPQLPKGLGFLVGVSISKPAFCTLNDLSQNARRGMSLLRRVEPKNSGLSSFYCGKDESLPQELVGESFLAILTV